MSNLSQNLGVLLGLKHYPFFNRDGGYETSPLIGKYCGTNAPPIIVSHSNRLWLKLRSDHSLTYGGFAAHWDGTQTGMLFCVSRSLLFVVPLEVCCKGLISHFEYNIHQTVSTL